MRIIVHSPEKAVMISKASFSFLLKLGYILADETCSMGHAGGCITLIKKLEGGTKEFKFQYLLNNLDPAEDPEMPEMLQLYFKCTKEYEKIKHKTSDQVKFYKGLEHNLLHFYAAWLKCEIDKIDPENYRTIIPLIDGKELGFYFLKEDKIKYEHDVSKFQLDLKDFLYLKLPDTDCKKSMMAFHAMFFNNKILKEVKFVSPYNDEAKNTQTSYFHYVAAVTNLNNLSESELRAVRNSFTHKLSSFRNIMDNWMTICNTSDDTNEGLTYFKEKVIPELSVVEESFNKESIFNYDLQDKNKANLYIYIGEISQTALLNYYTTMKLLSSDERDELEKTQQMNGKSDRRIPMMIFSIDSKLELPHIYDESDLEEEVIKRKFIEVD